MIVVELTGTENPEVPPMLPEAAERTSATTYCVPGLRMVTEVTAPPATTMFAVAFEPDPPVRATLA